jgi:hypothetical protein
MALKFLPAQNILVVSDPDSGYLAKVYSLVSNDSSRALKFMKSFIRKGEGRGELVSISNLDYNSTSKTLNVTDGYKKQVFIYPLDSIISPSSEAAPTATIYLRASAVYHPLSLNNEFVDLRSNSNKDAVAVLNFYDSMGDLKSFGGSFPIEDARYKPVELRTVFSSFLARSAEGDRIYNGYFYMDFLESFDSKGKLLNRTHGPDRLLPSFQKTSYAKYYAMTPSKNSRLGYRKLVSCNHSLYALYDGRPTSSEDYHVKRIFAFDSNLNPTIDFHLDIGIFDFEIDSDTNLIYALTHQEKGKIVLFKL